MKIGDYAMPVYEARPQSGSGHPVLLVISEIWGVHEYVRHSTRRFAKEGFHAVAPELFQARGRCRTSPERAGDREDRSRGPARAAPRRLPGRRRRGEDTARREREGGRRHGLVLGRLDDGRAGGPYPATAAFMVGARRRDLDRVPEQGRAGHGVRRRQGPAPRTGRSVSPQQPVCSCTPLAGTSRAIQYARSRSSREPARDGGCKSCDRRFRLWLSEGARS